MKDLSSPLETFLSHKSNSASRTIANAGGSSRATLADVARHANVSPATVSRAINTPDLVAESTRLLVREAIVATGYVPNLLAGGLASNRSRLVAVVVPALANSIFNEMIESMTEQLMAARYQVMLSLSGYQDQHLAEIVDAVLARRPEGVILTGTITDPALRSRLVSTGATIIETRTMPAEPIDYVVGFSHHDIGVAVAEIFHELGRVSPLAISADTARAMERLGGFTVAMSRRGVRKISTITLPIPASFAQGRAALAEFLDGGGATDCVMCGSDWQAHGVLVEAHKRGIRVPEDLAVIGFGNMDFADATDPSLTSVHIEGREIGEAAAQILVDRAAGVPSPQKVLDVGFSIVRRASA